MISCVAGACVCFYVGLKMLQADKYLNEQRTQTYFHKTKNLHGIKPEFHFERFVDIFVITNKSFAFYSLLQNIVLEIGNGKCCV